MSDRSCVYGDEASELPEEVMQPPVEATGSAKQDEIEIIKTKVLQLIKAGRRAGYRWAADNLEHWLTGKGVTKTMPAQAVSSEPFMKQHLNEVHYMKFLAGAERRLKSGELRPGGRVSMYWEDSVVAPTDSQLWFALGGFTVRSDVEVSAQSIPDSPDSALVRFERWTVRGRDVYNWDPGKKTVIPMFGIISDEEMDRLEQEGHAMGYSIVIRPFNALGLIDYLEVSIQY